MNCPPEGGRWVEGELKCAYPNVLTEHTSLLCTAAVKMVAELRDSQYAGITDAEASWRCRRRTSSGLPLPDGLRM
jgi:hypothetical protein